MKRPVAAPSASGAIVSGRASSACAPRHRAAHCRLDQRHVMGAGRPDRHRAEQQRERRQAAPPGPRLPMRVAEIDRDVRGAQPLEQPGDPVEVRAWRNRPKLPGMNPSERQRSTEAPSIRLKQVRRPPVTRLGLQSGNPGADSSSQRRRSFLTNQTACDELHAILSVRSESRCRLSAGQADADRVNPSRPRPLWFPQHRRIPYLAVRLESVIKPVRPLMQRSVRLKRTR